VPVVNPRNHYFPDNLLAGLKRREQTVDYILHYFTPQKPGTKGSFGRAIRILGPKANGASGFTVSKQSRRQDLN